MAYTQKKCVTFCLQVQKATVPATNDKEEHKLKRLHNNTFLRESPIYLLLNAVVFRTMELLHLFFCSYILVYILEPSIYTPGTAYIPGWTKNRRSKYCSTQLIQCDNEHRPQHKKLIYVPSPPTSFICRRLSSLFTQHLQAYRGAKGGHVSLFSVHLLPIIFSRHDNAFYFSINKQRIMINQSTFYFPDLLTTS